MKKISIKINGKEFKFNRDFTILQACETVGVEIPRFCYHDTLSIAGNCRMCLVEVGKSIKPVASCAMNILEGMEIFTNTNLVKKAREGILEFILINHPLDCAICDQGGECDLQDLTLLYSSDRGRYYENKRAVINKNCGPFVKTLMTRCIHCTRCVRFSSEIGVSSLGVVGRGNKMEIGTYIENFLESELSGNIIDLCPVGALTSKPYAFIARPWELKSINSIDLMDSFASNIRIDFRGSDIVRILPRINNNINESWISDKIRFCYDFVNKQRLLTPLIRVNNFLLNVSWAKAFLKFKLILCKNINSFFRGILGDFIDIETIFAFKNFLSLFDKSFIIFEKNISMNNIDFRKSYLFNDIYISKSKSDGLFNFKKKSLIFLIGYNPRLENPVFNSFLKKNSKKKNLFLFSIGINYNFSYYLNNLSNNVMTLLNIYEGRHWVCPLFFDCSKVNFIYGSSFLFRKDNLLFDNIHTIIAKNFLKRKVDVYKHYIQPTLSHNNYLEYGLFNFNNKILNNLKYRNTYLKNFNYHINTGIIFNNVNDCANVYQGFIGNTNLNYVDIILPSCSFVEKSGSYINSLGITQNYKRVFMPYGESRVDWEIISNLFLFLSKSFLFKDRRLFDKNIFLLNPSYKQKINLNDGLFIDFNKNYLKSYKNYLNNSLFKSTIVNFYSSDIISKCSFNLSLASKLFIKSKNNFFI